jgi:hypothetical protein
MQVISLPDEVLQTVSSNNGLSAYLIALQSGRKATPRSWLYEGQPAEKVLDKWLSHLDKLKDSKLEAERLVYQFDTSQLKKFGPQGKVPPIGELDDILYEGFQHADAPCPAPFRSDPLWRQAKEIAVDTLFKQQGMYKKLRPRSFDAVIDDMAARDTLFSNSGFPDFAKRKLESVRRRAIGDARSGKWRDHPAIVLFRNYNQKTRPVWMYPMATNLVEGSFTQPLKEHLKKLPFFAPWRGYDDVRQQMSEVYSEPTEYVAASDFSHTDAYYTKWQMLECYDVVKYAFQEQYWDLLKESMLRVTSIPLIIGPDKMIVGDHGVSSGSNWTNDVETILDYVAEVYLTLLQLVIDVLNAVGDDVSHRVKVFNAKFSEQVAKVYASLGFDVNSEKVTNEVDWVKYLQRLTIRGYFRDMDWIPVEKRTQLRGVYSTIRALNSSLNPEKFHKPQDWSVDMFCVRQFMILENCIDHPLFVEFVKFVCAGNKHLVEFAKRSADKQDKAFQASRTLPGLNPTYNQEKRDSKLSSFASIAIARKL